MYIRTKSKRILTRNIIIHFGRDNAATSAMCGGTVSKGCILLRVAGENARCANEQQQHFRRKVCFTNIIQVEACYMMRGFYKLPLRVLILVVNLTI